MATPHGSSEILNISVIGITNTTTVLAAQDYDFWVLSYVLEVAVVASATKTVRLNGTLNDKNVMFTQADVLKTVNHTFKVGFFVPALNALELTVSDDGTYNLVAEIQVKTTQNF